MEYVSMNTYASLADIVDSSTIPCASASDDGKHAATKLLQADRPQVAFIQRTCDNFEKFLTTVETASPPPPHPFVLIAVNGDPPLTDDQQSRIARLPNLKACYATEMYASSLADKLVHPMPLGMRYHHAGNYEPILLARDVLVKKKSFLESSRHVGLEAVRPSRQEQNNEVLSSTIDRVKASAKSFAQRELKLLVPPMGDTHPIRKELRKTLAKPSFKDLVHIVDSRLELEEYLTLVSQFKAVLSPPGVSYDCFRTWEAVAVGSAPALYNPDDMPWDMGLYTATGLSHNFLPTLETLSPASLKSFLSSLADPESSREYIKGAYWSQKWRGHLDLK